MSTVSPLSAVWLGTEDDAEWSGINALLYYGPTLMRELGLQGESVTLTVSGGIGIVQFLAVLPAIVFIDRLGALWRMACAL